MARFILDISTHYKEDRNKTKALKTLEDIETDFQKFMQQVGRVAENLGSCCSISIVDEHNTGQFHERTYLNKLTKKQIRTFNQEPHG